jgi:GNAT superfamily N-acetyltransferase
VSSEPGQVHEHSFPSDFPSVEVASGLVSMLLANVGFYSVVAERDGEVIGRNFLDERGQIAGVGPITVRPGVQNCGVGRLLMEDVLERARSSAAAGIRLQQAAYHSRSLALYASLGFAVREPIACLQGPPINTPLQGPHRAPRDGGGLEACNRVCHAVHGHDREGELRDAIGQGSALVVERDGRVSGYASAIAFFGHAAGETTDDVKALLAGAPAFEGPGVLVPLRNAALFRWCLDNGLRVVQVMTLMTLGLYNDPDGAYLPSIFY